MPFSAASRMVSRREQATQSGGWGFCTGLGTTLRGGIDTKRPSTPVKGSSVMHRTATSSPSSQASRFSSKVLAKPPSSATLDDSPDPKSTRPFETRSSIATRSAVRAGWLNRGEVRMIPWPRRMRLVRWLAGGQEHLGCRGVRVLLEEVVLDLPDVLDAQAVGQLDLVEGVLHQLAFGVLLPGTADLVLVEDPELHAVPLDSPVKPVRSRVSRPGRAASQRGYLAFTSQFEAPGVRTVVA